MINKKIFKNSIAIPLETAGFVHRGQTWYLNGMDVLIVISLQKSDFDDAYYINIGFWLKGLGEPSYPSINHCHLYYRAERLFPDKRELILRGCSLEEGSPELLNDLSIFLETIAIPFLRECTTENKLRELMSHGLLNQGMVLKEAREYLEKS